MRLTLLITLLLFCFSLQAQRYSKVKVKFDDTHQLAHLAEMGLDVDHGKHQPGKYFVNAFSEHELAAIQAEGFSTEILIKDLQAHLNELNEKGLSGMPTLHRSGHCNDGPIAQYETPVSYFEGSMGGYFTYQEMLDNLDSMAAKYPDIFKARQPITTDYTTHDGNTLYWVKISDDPETDDASEPELMYNALHHAREPNSLSQLLFYMWYLLENYETDEEVKYLVDNVEMYFVPCLNPDGYRYNELTNPDGGGFWRKNRRDNGDGTFGVDLNRNYDYEWGFDDQGSSPVTNSQTYRGPSPASEPETQMINEFCEAHDFGIALNYHTHGELLIYPWGYTDSASDDHDVFTEFSGFMVGENDFLAGFASQTVGYSVNGTSDDWMYGITDIYSMTPEVGYAFWPSQADIDALNKTCMTMNLRAAHLVTNFGVLRPAGEKFISSQSGEVTFGLRKMGLADGTLQVSLEPVSDNVASVGSPKNYGLIHLDDAVGDIAFTLKPDISEGETVQFNLVLDNGTYQWREPVERIYSTNVGTVLAEPGDDLSQWSSNSWSTTTEDYHSAPSSITDSDGVDYLPNTSSLISQDEPVQIEGATDVRLTFWARWDIEEDEDWAQTRLSVNGGGSLPLCGKYTETGTDEQDYDEPIYDGNQQAWVREEIDLTEYLDNDGNATFSVSFLLTADEAIEMDGFYFDDLEFTVIYDESVSSTFQFDSDQFSVASRPNPARDYVYLDIEGEIENTDGLNLLVFNKLGQNMISKKIQGKVIQLATANWAPGIYHYQISDGEQAFPAGRFLVVE